MSKFNDHKHGSTGSAKIVAPTHRDNKSGVPKDVMETPMPQKTFVDKKKPAPGARHSDALVPSVDEGKEQQDDKSNNSTQNATDNTMRQQKQQKQYQREPLQQFSSVIDVAKAKWEKHIGAAKIVWGKLTYDEIRQSEGRADKLAGLVCERYAMSRYEADEQVKNFLDKCKN